MTKNCHTYNKELGPCFYKKMPLVKEEEVGEARSTHGNDH